uniref:gamma-glutamyltransferase n=1 Tax=Streptacidiphilus albus TaxID=105425 RepID=UPI00128CCB21
MTWLEPGLPNSLTPGRRPRTTLSPSLALRDGVPVLAFGTPGGDQQDQSITPSMTPLARSARSCRNWGRTTTQSTLPSSLMTFRFLKAEVSFSL